MLYSDKPIDRPRLDLLGRAGFALSLAQSIDTLAVARDGFVIGIQGEWGSGKTSLIEMVCRYLRHIEMQRISTSPLDLETEPVPVTLNDLEEMAEVFERVEPLTAAFEADQRYSRAVRAPRDGRWQMIRKQLNSDAEADSADRYWRLRTRSVEIGRTIIVRFSPWLISSRVELATALISDLSRAIGEKLGTDIRRAFAALLKRLSEFAPIAGSGLDLAAHGLGVGAFARLAGAWYGTVAERMASGPTLDAIREELRRYLAHLRDRKVVVVVDDLDRLTPPDALEMVSVVKSLGDLPNVVYLLSYEEEKLSQALAVALKMNGHEYLEKIVQYPDRFQQLMWAI